MPVEACPLDKRYSFGDHTIVTYRPRTGHCRTVMAISNYRDMQPGLLSAKFGGLPRGICCRLAFCLAGGCSFSIVASGQTL